jgi:hypothetical protein
MRDKPRDEARLVYGGYEPVRDLRTGEIIALLPLLGPHGVPPEPRGWALMLLQMSWDALVRRKPRA